MKCAACGTTIRSLNRLLMVHRMALLAISEDSQDPDIAEFAYRFIDGSAGFTPERARKLRKMVKQLTWRVR